MLNCCSRHTAALIVLIVILNSVQVSAHDFPLYTVANAFVKISPNQTDMVVRIPLDLLHSVHFPMTGAQYDLASAGPAIEQAVNGVASDIAIFENGTRLIPARAQGRLSLPSDKSFEDYDQAVASVFRPTDLQSAIYFDQGFLDVHLVYPIQSPNSVFTIQTVLAQDLKEHTKLSVRFMPPNATSRALMIYPTSGQVALNPPWYRAATGFITLGVGHILSGFDHLLFLFCLVIPFRRLRALIPVVTAFTVGHSATLIATAYDLAPKGDWFPPFVETAIAVSIVYMAVENIAAARLDRRWLIAGLFGLVHGFGFSYALKENLQFAGSHLLTSLLAFNLGIEIGQLLILSVMVAGLALLFLYVRDKRIGVIVLSAFVAHTAWHWMIERGEVLWQKQSPQLDAHAVVILARWVAVLLLAAGAVKLIETLAKRKRPQTIAVQTDSAEKSVA